MLGSLPFFFGDIDVTSRINGDMAVSDPWTEILGCPECALAGVASLSQPEDAAEARVSIPDGFKRVTIEFGDTFFCVACDRPARATIR
jgi:hypothetical protein